MAHSLLVHVSLRKKKNIQKLLASFAYLVGIEGQGAVRFYVVVSFFFFFLTSLLECNCFTMVC